MCGKTRSEDMTVSYHRSPNPGIANKARASAWAKYCYPTEDWDSLEFLQYFYRRNNVLCGRHFHSFKFYDNMRQKLSIHAIPDSDDVEEVLKDRENIFTENGSTNFVSTSLTLSPENVVYQQTTADILPPTVRQALVPVESKKCAAGLSKLLPIEATTSEFKPVSIEQGFMTGLCTEKILTECINEKIDIVGTICDLTKINIKTLKNMGATTREAYFNYMDREYVAILDSPHLQKCTWNLLLKHNVECTTEFNADNIPVKGIVKWSHIEAFYNLDKSNTHFVYAPALTDQHIHPNVKQQMRVKLAAQVFQPLLQLVFYQK